MAIQFRPFDSVRDKDIPLTLQNDLRYLERFLKSVEERVALLDGSESLGITQVINNNSNLAPHAFTHASPVDPVTGATASDPITKFKFNWTRAHNITPTKDEVPLTLKSKTDAMANVFDVFDNTGNVHFEVINSGRVSINNGETPAELNIKANNTSPSSLADSDRDWETRQTH